MDSVTSFTARFASVSQRRSVVDEHDCLEFKTVARFHRSAHSTFSRLDKPGDAWSSFSKMSKAWRKYTSALQVRKPAGARPER